MIVELIRRISESSENKENIVEAFKEWEVISRYEEWKNCICNHQINECYVIKNKINGTRLDPIGSTCILKFGNKEMTKQVEELMKVECTLCKKMFADKRIYGTHLKSDVHKYMLETRSCLDCDFRIPLIEPDWKTRCIKCYAKGK